MSYLHALRPISYRLRSLRQRALPSLGRAATVNNTPATTQDLSLAEADSLPSADPELKLPKMTSLVAMLVLNGISHVTNFIVIPSTNEYAEYLGGNTIFAGLSIGITAIFAGTAIPPLLMIDNGTYMGPVIFSCVLATIGNILYGLAFLADYVWLILIGRIVTGIGLVSFMYTKRYVTDGRIVGVRRRTTVSSWLVVGQNVGFTLGPFAGGLLYKVGFRSSVFNGYTSPGWVMAGVWVAFWIYIAIVFEDVAPRARTSENSMPMQAALSTSYQASDANGPSVSATDSGPDEVKMTWRSWLLIFTMSWFAMTCFFVVGAWQAALPPYTAEIFNYSPFAAGNFMALGGLCTFPFIFLNLIFSRRLQDRHILVYGCSTGFCGLFLMMFLVHFDKITFGSLFICTWLVFLGFSVATTSTVSLLSKQLPQKWNGRLSMAIQYGNYIGRVLGTVWGSAYLRVGMLANVGLEVGVLGLGAILTMILWKDMKSKVG